MDYVVEFIQYVEKKVKWLSAYIVEHLEVSLIVIITVFLILLGWGFKVVATDHLVQQGVADTYVIKVHECTIDVRREIRWNIGMAETNQQRLIHQEALIDVGVINSDMLTTIKGGSYSVSDIDTYCNIIKLYENVE